MITASPAERAEFSAAIRRALHPPVREWRFWAVQVMVVLIAIAHIAVDWYTAGLQALPYGIPVALWVIPVSYAAVRYGLAGSAATGLWATLLWLPDIILPDHRGHVGSDVVELVLVDVIAFFVGQRIQAERIAHTRVQHATTERLGVEARYRQLFEATQVPTLVLDAHDVVVNANPTAQALFGGDVIGQHSESLLGRGVPLGDQSGFVLRLPDGRDYRLDAVSLPPGAGIGAMQVVFQDVTEERSEGRRASRYAALVVRAEEEQRRRLSRELHDEPLQLFLHLARRLEILGEAAGVPSAVASGLTEAREQSLDAAARLRTLARDLRPPALDQLGLVAALSSLLVDLDEEVTGLGSDLVVTGEAGRLDPDVELGAFRIAQEALRNAVRHGKASSVRMTVAFGAEDLALAIADDGCGFEPSAIGEVASDHFGLLGMAERASLLGGQFDVSSSPGTGTVVTATLPFRGPDSDDGPLDA